MVTVKDYHLRKNAEGQAYVSLELIGQVELVQSQNTGRFYATQRRCFIYSTFDEKTASGLIGTGFPGSIVRVPCDPYEYVIPENGQKVILAHRYSYVPEENTVTVPVRKPVFIGEEE